MNTNTKVDLRKMNTFLRKYKTVDFRTADLLNSSRLADYKWPDDDEEKHHLLGQIKAYQRLLRILPTNEDKINNSDIARELLKAGIHSALQITSMGRKKFIKETIKIFCDDKELALGVYKRALACRKLVAIKYIHLRQRLEPHARAAGLNL